MAIIAALGRMACLIRHLAGHQWFARLSIRLTPVIRRTDEGEMTATTVVDITAERLVDVRVAVETAFGITLDPATARYGNKGDTLGMVSDAGRWVRFQWRRPDSVSDTWTGPETASALTGVVMPQLFRSLRWPDAGRSVVWRADEFSLVTDAAVSGPGSIDTAPELPDTWWATLHASLTALAAHDTARVAMESDHMARRIREVFGDEVTEIDLTVPEWRTAHGDCHWGNLTAPSCVLLDWESWGQAPRGYDAATLWGFSLGVPDVASRIESEFVDDLSSRSGLLSRLLFCANVLRQFARRGIELPFTAGVREVVPVLLNALG